MGINAPRVHVYCLHQVPRSDSRGVEEKLPSNESPPSLFIRFSASSQLLVCLL